MTDTPRLDYDVTRRPVSTKTGLRFWGYRTRRELAREATRSTNDALTGLLNRTGWDLKVSAYVALARRQQKPVAFMIFDLDDLKKTNDESGHAAGDRLLIEFARQLEKAVRESDIVARIGGDEFAVCLENTTLAAAKNLQRRIEEDCEAAQIKFSLGSSELADNEDYPEAVGRADRNMYEMKAEHKNKNE